MRTQAGKMKGGVILRGKVWYGMLKEDGKWKWKRLLATTKHDAVEERTEMQKEINGNWGRGIRAITFEALAEKWLQTQRLTAKPNTEAFYKGRLNLLKQFFGAKDVDKILPEQAVLHAKICRERAGS